MNKSKARRRDAAPAPARWARAAALGAVCLLTGSLAAGVAAQSGSTPLLVNPADPNEPGAATNGLPQVIPRLPASQADIDAKAAANAAAADAAAKDQSTCAIPPALGGPAVGNSQ
jgi:hypothetical protein